MKYLLMFEKRLLIGLAASQALHALMVRQQDIGPDTSPSIVKTRAAATAKVAVVFARALWNEMVTQGTKTEQNVKPA